MVICHSFQCRGHPDLSCSLQEHLLALHKKLAFVKANELAAKSAAMQDIAPELERLRAKAVIKSRDLLMARYARSAPALE
jgi:hypothetical protein